MAELEGTADHIVVLGRGRLLADAPMATFIGPDGTPRTLVRSQHLGRAMATLARAGAHVTSTSSFAMEVVGMAAEDIARLLSASGVPFHGIESKRRSLEEAYFELTSAAAEHVTRQEICQ